MIVARGQGKPKILSFAWNPLLNKLQVTSLLCPIPRVGQNRIYTPYMTVYLVVFLPKIPYIYGSGQLYLYLPKTLVRPKNPNQTHLPPQQCFPLHFFRFQHIFGVYEPVVGFLQHFVGHLEWIEKQRNYEVYINVTDYIIQASKITGLYSTCRAVFGLRSNSGMLEGT